MLRAQFSIHFNELIALNTQSITDDQGELEDWIELKNYGETAICLEYWFISQSINDPFQFQFPPSALLCMETESFIVLFADAEPNQGALHLPFELNAEGESLYLFNPEGNLISSIDFGQQYANISFGRQSEDEEWNYFLNASPGSANPESGLWASLSAPSANFNSGYFTEIQMDIILEHEEWAEIRYRTDGASPGPFDALYSESIALNVPGILRTKAFAPGYLPGDELVIHALPQPSGNISSLSIAMNPADLFGNNGIYTYIYSGIEKASHISYLQTNQTLALNQSAGIRIHAPDYRDQQGFRLSSRAQYGSDVFNAALFPDRAYSEFQHLIFRSGGNDGVELGQSGLRDPLLHHLFSESGLNRAYSAYRPVEIYLNGSFWGLYEMRERQDENYIQSVYNIENFDLLERSADAVETNTYNAIRGDFNDFNALEQFAIDADLSDDSNYDFIRNWMDIANFSDYQLFEIFACNRDWLSNNVKMWRATDGSGSWNWILWDLDWAFGTMFPADHAYPNWNALEFALSDWGGWTEEIETELLQNLIENEGFKDYFCTRAADLSNDVLRPAYMIECLDSLQNEVSADIPKQCERWGGTHQEWLDECNDIRGFIEDRKAFFLQHFSDRFELGQVFDLQLNIIPVEAGYIEINTIGTNVDGWTGDYFQNLPVQLRAIARSGYVFEGWGEYGNNDSLEVIMLGNQQRTAYFQAAISSEDPVINEIYANALPSELGNVWIELFNPSNETIHLQDWKLGNEAGDEFTLTEEFEIEGLDYVILAENPDYFISSYNVDPDHVFNLQIPLNPQSGTIYLLRNGNSVSDLVNYRGDNFWPECEAENGYSIELSGTNLNNELGINWFCRDRMGGSPGEANLETVTRIEESDINAAIRLFPNPCRDLVFIESVESLQNAELMVYDMNGVCILKERIDQNKSRHSILLSPKMSAGMYFYEIILNGKSIKGKLVKLV